jgi:4-diphosphocytidyl-2-C-methyl-D-erythritol kinase
MTLSFAAPAKVNLFLAITGRRADGFHELVSVVAPVDFGDTLSFQPSPGEAGGFSLVCDDPTVPTGEENLVLKAAGLFCQRSGWKGGGRFVLTKRIPLGAGLGGGSSDAVAALRALNQAAGAPLDAAALALLAASLGSDCPLFLSGGPWVMRGRGERLEPLPSSARQRLSGRGLLLFKPSFGISTPWAYQQLAAGAPASYLPPAEAEARLAGWLGRSEAPAEELLFNNMEPPAFRKFVALPVLLGLLAERFGLQARMSGSGSACFALLKDDTPVESISAAIREAWGGDCFVHQTRLG